MNHRRHRHCELESVEPGDIDLRQHRCCRTTAATATATATAATAATATTTTRGDIGKSNAFDAFQALTECVRINMEGAGFKRNCLRPAKRENDRVIKNGILDRLVSGHRDGVEHISQTDIIQSGAYFDGYC